MSAMDAKVVDFYRQIYADLAVDSEEAAALTDFLVGLNPPPDKLLWMRAAAFRIASEFLGDDKDANVSLLRTANFIVHAIENNCMQPRELDGAGPVDEEALADFYKKIFEDMTVDGEENADLIKFFKEDNPPAADSMVTVRATAFKVACDFLSDDDKDHNTQLLRCINAVVHAFEITCLAPKPFELKEEEVMNLDVNLSDAVNQLWALDANRLDPNIDYTINVQDGKKPYWTEDKAEDPLFSYVDQSVLRRPTFSSFIALLDNYSSKTGIAEVVTSTERAEVKRFLERVMETKPMQFCHRYCHAKNPNLVPSSRGGFIDLLQKIWFDLYRRETSGDSSGFEHVFVGEEKDGKISGFHNWLRLYLEEKAGNLDYRGYIKPRGNNEANTNNNDQLLTIQFIWNGVEKSVGSSFIGTSPEFELAIYTLCFLVGEEENDITLAMGEDTFEVAIKCYRMARDKVGTSFPEIKSHYD